VPTLPLKHKGNISIKMYKV